jgi:hypothetical protein
LLQQARDSTEHGCGVMAVFVEVSLLPAQHAWHAAAGRGAAAAAAGKAAGVGVRQGAVAAAGQGQH